MAGVWSHLVLRLPLEFADAGHKLGPVVVALVGLGLLCSAGLTIGGAVRGDFAASSQVGPCVPPAGDSSL